MLKQDPELADDCDVLGRNALHWAAKRELKDMVELLLIFDADGTRKDIFGISPEEAARRNGNMQIAHMIEGNRNKEFQGDINKFRRMEIFSKKKGKEDEKEEERPLHEDYIEEEEAFEDTFSD